ncbi:MAG: hypothetical protein ACRD0K_19175 [Egibacteraceae bacterium]
MAERHVFGRRHVVAAPVIPRGVRDACWMEAVADGWVFLAPAARGRRCCRPWLPAGLRILRRRCDGCSPIRAADPHACGGAGRPGVGVPRRATAAGAAGRGGWLAVGDAAIALDPVSGDGAGHGLRGAILAAAVVEAIASGQPARACPDHCHARLTAALRVHLQRCLVHYTAFTSPPWRDERAVTAGALASREATPAFRYGLHGLLLTPLGVGE